MVALLHALVLGLRLSLTLGFLASKYQIKVRARRQLATANDEYQQWEQEELEIFEQSKVRASLSLTI